GVVPAADGRARPGVPGHQSRRVDPRLPRAAGAGAGVRPRALGRDGRAAVPGAAVLPVLLRDDRAARLAHDRRHGRPAVAAAAGGARRVRAGVLHAGRDDGAVLALRGRGVDFSVPAVLPDRHGAPLGGAMHPHVFPPKVYLSVFGALIVLTVLTVAAAQLELGVWHTAVGLVIAVVKATLVFLFFMHLWHSDRLTWIVAGGALLWVGILFALTLSDYLSRTVWPVPRK